MNITFALGRVALVAMFLVLGVTKLLDIDTTTEMISRVPIPSALAGIAAQIAAQSLATLNMPAAKILAILVGGIEVAAAVLVMFNVATRTAATVLLLFTATTVFFVYNFWGLPDGLERTEKINHAWESLSIIGGFLILAAMPRRFWIAETREPDQLAPL